MGRLRKMDSGIGFVKAGFQGSQGSGKTHTATLFACGVHRTFGCKSPVLCVDTEGGLRFRKAWFEEHTGQTPFELSTRNFRDMMEGLHEAEKEGVEVVVIDSVTHLWQGLMRSYQAGLAERFNKSPTDVKLRLDDIGKIKDLWQPFADWFVASPMHVVACGRLGYVWDHVENDRGEEELRKIGTKMKAESEFGYESDLSFEMEQIQDEHPAFQAAKKDGRIVARNGIMPTTAVRCRVIKDRWDIMTGATMVNPAFDFFAPLLNRYKPSAPPSIDLDPGVQKLSETGRSEYQHRKRIELEVIENGLVRTWPSTSGKDRAAKLEFLESAFGTTSWSEIQSMHLDSLRALRPNIMEALSRIRANEPVGPLLTKLAEHRASVVIPGTADAPPDEPDYSAAETPF